MTLEIKAILALAAAGILGAIIWWFGFHERSIEHAKDVAADTKAVAVQTRKDDQVVAADTEIVKKEAFDYAKSLDTPVAHAPVVSVCVNAPSPVPAPAEAQARPRADATPVVRAADPPVPAERRWDTSPIVQIGHDADAQIKGLQDYINRVCPTL